MRSSSMTTCRPAVPGAPGLKSLGPHLVHGRNGSSLERQCPPWLDTGPYLRMDVIHEVIPWFHALLQLVLELRLTHNTISALADSM